MHFSLTMRLLSSRVRGLASVPPLRHAPRAAHLYGAAQVSGSLGHSAVPESPVRRADEPDESSAMQRLSPAARLGTSKVSGHSVVHLPDALADAVESHVLRGNKLQLRRDATHLLDLKKTPQPGTFGLAPSASDHFADSLHGTRAASLYLATKFPARYAVLVRVLDEVRRRMLPDAGDVWIPEKIMDYNCQAADVLWAARAAFGAPMRDYSAEAWSTELLSTASQLVRELRRDPASHLGALSASFRLRGDKPSVVGRAPRDVAPTSTLGVLAYGLAPLPNDAARERQVLRLWKSGAEAIVLVEEATPRGFAAIASARAQLLALGKDGQESHVVAPCPHDGACPMLHAHAVLPPSRSVPNVCSYSQMYHAPSPTRATLHDGRSDRVEEYCYVVVRRGPRPSLAASASAWSEAVPFSRPTLDASLAALAAESKSGILDELRSEKRQLVEVGTEAEAGHEHEACAAALREHGVDAQRVMQLDAFSWPRLIRTPLKKGGHVTLDACCASGALERFTVAKSAGRQAYQDARKARGGELFAHADKSSRPTVVREAVDVEYADAPKSHEAYMALGPDAQLSARTAGMPKVPKRAARRAPKRRILDADRAGRLSRKPDRAALDDEFREADW